MGIGNQTLSFAVTVCSPNHWATSPACKTVYLVSSPGAHEDHSGQEVSTGDMNIRNCPRQHGLARTLCWVWYTLQRSWRSFKMVACQALSLTCPGCSSQGSIPISETRKSQLKESRLPRNRSLKLDLSPTFLLKQVLVQKGSVILFVLVFVVLVWIFFPPVMLRMLSELEMAGTNQYRCAIRKLCEKSLNFLILDPTINYRNHGVSNEAKVCLWGVSGRRGCRGSFKLISASDQAALMTTCPSLPSPSSFLFITVFVSCYHLHPTISDITPSSQPLLTPRDYCHPDHPNPCHRSYHHFYREHFNVTY